MPDNRARLGRRQFVTGAAAVGAAGCLGAAAGLAACGSTPTPKKLAAPKRYGGNLMVGLTGGSSSDTLDPHQGLSNLDTARAQALYEPLVALGANAGIEDVLAAEMTPNAAATQWVIRLRPGVVFHDGTPLTANDVIYTFQRIIKNGYSAVNVLRPVDLAGIRALDTLTVVVPMTRPYATFPGQLAGILTAQIVPSGFTATSPPNGTGPFKYKSFAAGQRSVFGRNPHYWRHGLPYIDTLSIIDFPDTVSLQDALITGQIQAAGTLDPAQMPTLSTHSGIDAIASPAGTIVPFTMRVDQPPFNDVNVRQAMRLAVDRPQFIASALDGSGSLASDVFSPYDPDFDHALRREQDLPQARYLLRKAGLEDLTVTLVTSPITSAAVPMATVLAEQAKAAGVTINLQQVPSGTFFGPNYLSWGFSQDYYYYASYLAQVTLSMLPTSPWNETHFDDPGYNKLYAQANATLDGSLRREICYKMQATDFTQGGYIIPAFVDTLDAYSTGITGYASSKLGQPLDGYNFAHFAFTLS
jgi:peptide/nickel transport system substrate-binding protein